MAERVGRTAVGVRTVRVPDDPGRADRIVADATGLSRSHVQKLISGRLTAAASRCAPTRSWTRHGAAPRRPARRAARAAPEPDIALNVVYEDDDLLIVDKPAGLVVHPSPGHATGRWSTPARAGRWREYGGIAGVQQPGSCTTDRDTSGLLMVARHDRAQASLMAQLKARRIRKTYQALVQGSVSAAVGRIEAPIGRDPKHRTRMAVVPDGRPSPAIGSASGSTAGPPRARPGHRANAPDPRASSTRSVIRWRATRVRHRDVPAGPRRTRPAVLHAWRLELASPTDGHLIRATAPLPPELEGVLEAMRAGGVAPMTVRGPYRDGRRLDPYAMIDVSEDPGGPTTRSRGRRERSWPSSRGRPASARTRSSMPCVVARSRPATAAVTTTSSR